MNWSSLVLLPHYIWLPFLNPFIWIATKWIEILRQFCTLYFTVSKLNCTFVQMFLLYTNNCNEAVFYLFIEQAHMKNIFASFVHLYKYIVNNILHPPAFWTHTTENHNHNNITAFSQIINSIKKWQKFSLMVGIAKFI